MARSAAAPALAVLGDFAAALDPSKLSPEVVAKAKVCLVDALWGCLQVHTDSRARAALATVPQSGGQGDAVVPTTDLRASAADASFVGALACAATDRSDTHVATATHPGIVVVPAVLAALCARGGSGADLLRGIVAGYEAMARIARAVHSPELSAVYRPTAVSAPAAAAIAVAAAMRLDARQIAVAGSLAANTAFGLNEWARAGTGEHVVHAGVAARNAVMCAGLAAAGFEATPTALDGASGLLAAYGAAARAAELTRDLGNRFEILDIVFKPAPACFFAQTPAQVAAVAAATIPPDAAIEALDIRVTSAAATYPGCAATDGIHSTQAAVMSIPFAVAATLRAGRIDASAWSDFRNPDTAALARRSTVLADEALSRAYPARCGASLDVRLAGGATLAFRRDDFESMDAAAVIGRFREDGARTIRAAAVERTLAAIDRLEALPNVADLLAACAPQAAARRAAGGRA